MKKILVLLVFFVFSLGGCLTYDPIKLMEKYERRGYLRVTDKLVSEKDKVNGYEWAEHTFFLWKFPILPFVEMYASVDGVDLRLVLRTGSRYEILGVAYISNGEETLEIEIPSGSKYLVYITGGIYEHADIRIHSNKDMKKLERIFSSPTPVTIRLVRDGTREMILKPDEQQACLDVIQFVLNN